MQRLVDSYGNLVIEEEPNAGEEPLKKCDTETGMTFSPDGYFDCNICLDFAMDPVVTLCGHLYCWPCIYKWLQQSASTSSQQCPVCKGALSQETIVPLYGRGNNSKKSQQGIDIPQRPSVHKGLIGNQTTGEIEEQYQSNHLHNPQFHHNHRQEYPYGNGTSDSMLPSSPLGTLGVLHSTVGGFLAGLAMDFLPLIFRNQRFSGMYYSSPYYGAGNGGSPRLNRQELEHQRSLNQIWIFLFCCAILCLLLF